MRNMDAEHRKPPRSSQHKGADARPRPRRAAPPESTSAEAYYFIKQMQNKTPMTVVLKDGETLQGVIEWYDRTCFKLNRPQAPNLVLYKDSVKYLYKTEDYGGEEEELDEE